MKIIKYIIKSILYLLIIPVFYIIGSFISTFITIDAVSEGEKLDKTIYLSTNGIHLDVILPIYDIDESLLSGIRYEDQEAYLSFGWGDRDFYLHTPTWKDLTFGRAFKAMFLKSATLMHVTRYQGRRSDWVAIKISASAYQKLNQYLSHTFDTDDQGMKIRLMGKGYTAKDDFYQAKGTYSCFNTCNSWVNTGFKESGLKCCLWTPFDFGLLRLYP